MEQALGEGGAGAVYRARDTTTDEIVAIKFFPLVRASEEEFRREAAMAMRARHPNLVGLIDAGMMPDGRAWIVLELVAGMDLRTRLETDLPLREAVSLATQVFAALDALHRAGLAHGDIKPENVLVDGHVARVVDFGRARLAHLGDGQGVFPGTPPYMHPRLFAGGAPSPRTDCFAAWITAVELILGDRPWTSSELRWADEVELPARPPVKDPALEAILDAGLHGRLSDARAGWLALTRWSRGRMDLPRFHPEPPPPDPAAVDAVVSRGEHRRSCVIIGDADRGRAVLEAVHRAWVLGGRHVL